MLSASHLLLPTRDDQSKALALMSTLHSPNSLEYCPLPSPSVTWPQCKASHTDHRTWVMLLHQVSSPMGLMHCDNLKKPLLCRTEPVVSKFNFCKHPRSPSYLLMSSVAHQSAALWSVAAPVRRCLCGTSGALEGCRVHSVEKW